MIYSRMRESQHRRRIAGFGLWDSLLLVALVAVMLVAAFVSQQARTHLRTAEQQSATLLWADQQVAGFVASHLRLPCPDSNGSGLEDCTSGVQQGLLPLVTLGLQANAATRGPVRIKYNLQRPPGMDPGLLESYFEPQQWDGTLYDYGTSNGLDLCGKLVDIVNADPGAVAYSVALTREDGIPDLVKQHSTSDLASSLNCITTMSSVNGIALAVDVVNEVIDQQSSTNDAAVITIAFNVLHMALASIDAISAAVGLAASIATEVASAAALAGAIASCIVLVGCAFIAPYTAAVAAAAVAIGLYATTIALDAAAFVVLAVSTGLAIDVAIKTGNAPGNQTASVDLTQQEQAAESAEQTATDAENDAAAAQVTLQNALAARDLAYQQVIGLAQGSTIDTVLAAAVTLDNATSAQAQAQGNFDQANDRVTDLTASYTQAQASCASANLPSEQYKCDAVSQVNANLVQAQQNVTVTQTALTAANQQVVDATTAYNNAKTAVATAFPGLWVLSLQSAIDGYRDAYAVWQKDTDAYNTQEQRALDARSNATQARAAYNQLVASQAAGPTPTGSGIQVWAGAEAILKQADANGVVE